ncbi:MAG: hypothetical protein MI861_06420, partial [Pirellulales bacterium]|nr:hypothetical protein [Pirellulales bacterium]
LDHTMVYRMWNHGFGRGGFAGGFEQWLPFHSPPINPAVIRLDFTRIKRSMKLHSTIVVLLILACSIATADEPVQSQRFAIVQAASRTFLLDRVSGTTWVLAESPHLRWQEIPRDSASSLLSSPEAKRDVNSSKLKLVVDARKSADAGENVLVRASVTNPTSKPLDGITISFAPGKATVTRATSDRLQFDGDRCVWEVDRLDAGEAKVFETQLQFANELAGKKLQLTWALRDRSGGRAKQTLNIAVTAAGSLSDRVLSPSKVKPVKAATSDNDG